MSNSISPMSLFLIYLSNFKINKKIIANPHQPYSNTEYVFVCIFQSL